MSYLSDLLGDAYKEGMTEEEISTALQSAGAGAKDNEAEVNRLKAQLSKANSEAADYKKQLRGKQSEDEAAAAEQKATMDKLTQENADLKRSIALSEKKAKLLAMGYDEKLADDTATAMVDGDMDKVMANQTKYLEAREKDILAKKMKGTPRVLEYWWHGLAEEKRRSTGKRRFDRSCLLYTSGGTGHCRSDRIIKE